MVTVIVESVFVVWSNSLAHQRGLDLYDEPGKIRAGLEAPPGSQMTFFQEIDVGLFISDVDPILWFNIPLTVFYRYSY